MAPAFASFPVRVASDKAAALSANTGVPIVSRQHRVTKALAMEASLKVVPQRIQIPKMGFRTALRTLKPFASQDNPSASLGNADRGGDPFLGPPPRGSIRTGCPSRRRRCCRSVAPACHERPAWRQLSAEAERWFCGGSQSTRRAAGGLRGGNRPGFARETVFQALRAVFIAWLTVVRGASCSSLIANSCGSSLCRTARKSERGSFLVIFVP
jgi:hypothetical protein